MSESKVLQIFAVDKNKWTMHKDGQIWDGQKVTIRIILKTFGNRQLLCAEMSYAAAKKQVGFHLLGCVKQNYYPYYPVGMTKLMKIYATTFNRENGMVNQVVLFDPLVPQWQIDEWLNFK
ncbi:MAG: hypothetical protein ACKOQS_15065 [Dolichospermum sp.]